MAELSQLDQVRLDAQRITLKRMQEAEEQRKWQESKTDHISLGDEPDEVAVEAKPKTVKKTKGK